MDGWTKLHERATESVNLAELLDEEPEAFALFTLMLAKAGIWGRFPGHPKLLKSRVAPMSERLTSKRIAELIPLLEKHELVTSYTVDGVPLLYTTKHFTYNGKQAWHRIGRPEFPPPPAFTIPESLATYLGDVQAGKYKNKTVAGECEKMRLVYDHSTGVVHGSSLGLVTVETPLETLDVRRETLDVRNDKETDDKKEEAPPAPDLCDESFDPVIQAGMAHFTSTNPPILEFHKAQKYSRECRAQLQGNSDFTDEYIREAFRTNGPLSGNERTFPGNWLERLRKERDGPSNRASARTATLNQPASREAIARQAAAIGMGTETGDASDPLA